MAAVIRLKRSETASSVPTTSTITVGEVAVNTADQKIYTRDSSDNIVTLSIANLVDDATPQLGGNLDVNGSSIVSTSNADINISPNGSGAVNIDYLSISDTTISSINTDTDITLSPNGTGNVDIQRFSINTDTGTRGQIISTDGSGAIAWADKNVSYSVTQSSHGFSVGDVLYFGTGATYTKAQADDADTLGLFLVSEVHDTNNFSVCLSGKVTGLSGLTAGHYYFLSNSTAGLLTQTEPTSGYSNPLLFALSATSGVVLPFRPAEALEDNDIIFQSNTIATENTDQDLILNPNGSGQVQVSGDLDVTGNLSAGSATWDGGTF